MTAHGALSARPPLPSAVPAEVRVEQVVEAPVVRAEVLLETPARLGAHGRIGRRGVPLLEDIEADVGQAVVVCSLPALHTWPASARHLVGPSAFGLVEMEER